MRPIAAIPPTTPPTMAPVLDGVGVVVWVGAGTDVYVDTSVVMKIVDPFGSVVLVARVNECRQKTKDD